MKKYLCSLLSVLCILVLASCSYAGYYNEGHFGLTESDAYVIDSIADMIEFRDRINAGTDSEGLYYKLAGNLNLEAQTNWKPIGTGSRPFKGHFNGNGRTIKVKIAPIWTYGSALFGTVKTESGYAIKNLTVSGAIEDRHAVAGVAMELYNASIENCVFTGTLRSYGHQSSWSNEDLNDGPYDARAGGIIEHMFSGAIKNWVVAQNDFLS